MQRHRNIIIQRHRNIYRDIETYTETERDGQRGSTAY